MDVDEADHESNLVEVLSCANHSNECIIDSGSTHVILKEKLFFDELSTLRRVPVLKTLGGPVQLAKGVGTARLRLPGGTVLKIRDAIFAPEASRNLLSFAG